LLSTGTGAARGQGEILLRSSSSRNSLRAGVHDFAIDTDTETELVNIETIAQFCQDREIRRINFLKVDTEGYDLEVLKGAEEILDEGRIDFVQVEAV